MHESPDLPENDIADQLGPQLRAAFDADGVPPISPALAEFVNTPAGGAHAAPGDVRPVVLTLDAAESTTPRRKAMFTAFGAIAAKVALTASVTAAAATGAHATGIVDVPVLPDIGDRGESGITAAPDWTAAPLEGSASTDPTLVPSGSSTSTTPSTSATGPASSSTSTSTTSSSTSTSTTVPIEFGQSTHAVADVGAVVIEVGPGGVSVVEVVALDGWTAQVSTDTPGEAEVYFRRGDERVDFEAEIDDGRLKIEVRDRRLEDGGAGDYRDDDSEDDRDDSGSYDSDDDDRDDDDSADDSDDD